MIPGLLNKRPDVTLILKGRQEKEAPLSSDMGGGASKLSRALELAAKDFYMAGQKGDFKKAAEALAAFVDLHNDIGFDDMEDDESDLEE